MKKFIVITSISKPTKGLKEFTKKDGWNILVVGDKKTPDDWCLEGVKYLSVDDQHKLDFQITQLLPYNHYCRKMIGYLYAIKEGAEVIFDTDDDNIPYQEWDLPDFKFNKAISSETKFINIYKYFTDEHVWPRGLPLNQISNKQTLSVTKEAGSVGVWQGLADKDPDVDAIFRLVFDKEINFKNQENIAVKKGIYCPFNSQNTFWKKYFFSLMYLPSTVTFRFTDILRGYIAQRMMWESDSLLGFTQASVYQERNYHNLMKDFEQEIPVYTDIEKVVDILESIEVSNPEVSFLEVYKKLQKVNVVKAKKVKIANAWMSDLNNILYEK